MGSETVFVVGATGWSGAALCRRLAETGRDYVPVVRNAAKWRALGLPGERRVTDLTDWHSLADTLADASLLISCAHPRHVPALLAATDDDIRMVLLGNARRGNREPDGSVIGARAGEAAFQSSGRSGAMLHPTTIYGSDAEDGVQRLAALLRRSRTVPLPGGGRSLIQPIHQDDVTSCLLAAIDRDWPGPRSLTIAGPEAIRFAALVRAVAAAAGLPEPRIVPVPAPLLRALVGIAARITRLPRIGPDDLTLMEEDQAVPIEAMIDLLGVHPIALEDGLARCFSRTG